MSTLTMTEAASMETASIPIHSLRAEKNNSSTTNGRINSNNGNGSPGIGRSTAASASSTESLHEPPRNAVEALQKWNYPKANMYRVFATYWSFFIFGMNDGAYGALVPFLERYYQLTYTIVSLIFLSPFVGYTLASLLNNTVHVRLGQRGVAVIGPACHVIPYIVLAIHPPYPVIVVAFVFIGFGNGLVDAAWCAWLGNMAAANQVSGFLQACYSLGATISPLIATAFVEKQHLGWWSFYYLMIGLSTLELATSASTFWPQTGAVYREMNPQKPDDKTVGGTREALKNKITWVFALFVFGYVGAEVSLGGWIISFMTSVRGANSITAASTSTAFWGGMTVGRLVLPFLTAYMGEFQSVCLYLGVTIALELIFWLVPSLIVSAVAVSLLGLFMGQMFPTAIVQVTKLLPRRLHVGCIGFGTAFGGSGGAVFPFAVGVLAQAKGVKTLQPVILALFISITILWIMLPSRERPKDEDGVELEILE